MKKVIVFLSVLLTSSNANSQIQNDLIGIVDINNKLSVAKINPNTGNVTVLNPLPQIGMWGGLNSAVNCSTGDYVFSSTNGSQYNLSVSDKSNGSIKNTFGYAITGIVYNRSNGLYYGMEGQNFVSFNPVSGTKTVISSHALTLGSMLVGAAIDPNNSRYMAIHIPSTSGGNLAIFSLQTGSYTLTSDIKINGKNTIPFAWAYSQNKNKLLCLATTTAGTFFSDINLTSAIVNTISLVPITGMSGGGDARGGVTIDEMSDTYTMLGVKIYNINIASGLIISNPTLGANEGFFIQYATCSSAPVGIQESIIKAVPTYYDLFGNLTEPVKNTVLVELVGSLRRKVIFVE